MGTFIYFTDEQKRRANNVDLEKFLRLKDEKLLPSGRDKRLASDKSITIRGSEWFDHSNRKGGHAIDFVQKHYGLSFPEAVKLLLNGKDGKGYSQAADRQPEQPKPFVLPPANRDMRRVYAYLMKHRKIDCALIAHFAKAGTLYEDADYHNAVFVGTDADGVPRHAHKRSTNSMGEAFRLNVEGSDPRYSFHHLGGNGPLYVFEAPIDLLSYITLFPENWEDHSYVACCGTSSIPVVEILKQMDAPQTVFLCLDNDKTGQEAGRRMEEQIKVEFGVNVERLVPKLKDWNEDLCAMREDPGADMRMG